MDLTFAEVIARLPIRPGQSYRARVNGQEIEVRVLSADNVAEVVPAADLWLDIPPSSAARTLSVKRGHRQLPPPIHVDDTDLSPA
jgi:hypothetical protein